jgi:hypothetical protein
MSENKTKATTDSVQDFLDKVTPEEKKKDSMQVLKIMGEITKEKPKMWGSAIVGFGDYHYKYESGREGDFFLVGFSPRKAALTLYIMGGFDNYDDLMGKLGKFKTGKSCLYVKSLEDINIDVLKQLIKESVEYTKKSNK